MDKDSIIEWLHSKKGNWPEIALKADLNYHWLQKFAQGRIPEPGYTRLKKLERYILSAKKVSK